MQRNTAQQHALNTAEDDRMETALSVAREAQKDADDDRFGKDAENLSGALGARMGELMAVFGRLIQQGLSGLMAKVYQAIEINERKERNEDRLAEDLRRTERRREKEEKAQDDFESSVERMERQQKWERQVQSIGGVEMTGAEWDEALETVSDPVKKQKLLSHLMRKNGWSKERAEKAVNGAEELALIAQKEKDGTITAADRERANEITRTNPDAAVALKAASKRDFMNEQSLGAERQARDASWDGSSERSAAQLDNNAAAAQSSLVAWSSIENGRSTTSAAKLADTGAGDAKAAERPFASAPDLKKDFEEAKAKPADAPSPEAAPAAPAPQVMAKADLNSAFG